MSTAELDASFDFCRRVSVRAKSSFPLAFRLLPQDQRRGMTALYAWMRLTDDLADEHRNADFAAWRDQSLKSRDGDGAVHSVFPALHATVDRFQIPKQCLIDLLDGVASDLDPRPFATFNDLEPYCHRVASAVGLACLAIWGVRDPAATEPAKAAGLAFQLTNILRDIGEDHRNSRVYLPVDELERFDCRPETWGKHDIAFRRLMRFQIQRAREYYQKAEALNAFLPRSARAMYATMSGVYQSLLCEIERHPLAVLNRRLKVNPLRKIWIFVNAATPISPPSMTGGRSAREMIHAIIRGKSSPPSLTGG